MNIEKKVFENIRMVVWRLQFKRGVVTKTTPSEGGS